jgi:hypothetical protein
LDYSGPLKQSAHGVAAVHRKRVTAGNV